VYKKGQKLGISDFKDDFFNICTDSQKPL
jgi:hypothetical protein